MLLGDTKVGKSTICSLLRGVELCEPQKMTITIDYFCFKTDRVNISLWDTANGPYFEHILASFLEPCELLLFVCNNKLTSIEYIERFIKDYDSYIKNKQCLLVYFDDVENDVNIQRFLDKNFIRLIKVKNNDVDELRNYLINFTENYGTISTEEDTYVHKKTNRNCLSSCCDWL